MEIGCPSLWAVDAVALYSGQVCRIVRELGFAGVVSAAFFVARVFWYPWGIV